MPRYAQVVMGPAGSGKSTYCSQLQKHAADCRRVVHTINLDPAAENFSYTVSADIRELISVTDVAEELNLGPNGSLIYCMEYLLNNPDWLEEVLNDYAENDYILFDLPGQIELYTHFNFMKEFVTKLMHLDFRICAIYLMDSQFCIDGAKFYGGALSALAAMVQLEVPHINVMSKMDIAEREDKERIEEFLYPDTIRMAEELTRRMGGRFGKLNKAIGELLDDYGLVQFYPLDVSNQDNIASILLQVDMALQFDENQDVKHHSDDEG